MRRSMQALTRHNISRISSESERENFRGTRSPSSIGSACAKIGGVSLVKPDILSAAEIARVEKDAPRSMRLLIHYIHQHYYVLHSSDLSGLLHLVDCAEASPDFTPELIHNAKSIVLELEAALHTHMEHTEHILFPAAIEGLTASLGPMVDTAVSRNIAQLELLGRLRELTVNCTPHLVANPCLRGFCFGSRDFSEAVAARIHLENGVLFPTLLAG